MTEKAPELFGHNSTYRSVHALSFERSGGPAREGAMADRVAPWLRRLKSEDVASIHPLVQTCPFQHTGEPTTIWGIISDGDRGLEIWQPHWRARVISRDDPSPFKVVYTASRFNRWSLPVPSPVCDASIRLGQALQASVELCEKTGDRYAKLLARQCFEAHHTGRLEVPGTTDLIPGFMERSAAALAASATRVYNFIVSPTWNAMATIEPKLAEAMRAELWNCITTSFESVACAPMDKMLKSA